MKDRLVSRIRTEGPMPFEEFMREALYAPDGFFGSDTMRSVKGGDFLTSPEVSTLFGETIAAFVDAEHRRLGDPFALVEVAGGSGSLLRPLLAATAVEAWAVEASPAARGALAEIVGPDRSVSSLGEVPTPVRGVILANELLDNLPMAIAQLTEDGWRERWVGVEGGEGLAFVDAPVRPEVATWLAAHAGDVMVGGWVEVQLDLMRWIFEAVAALEVGSLILFDYGDVKENLVPRRQDGTLRTYRAHHLGPHPLDEPGGTDITADVNFSAAEWAAAAAGAEVEVFRQDDWLAAWGLRQRISEMRRAELELARAGDEMERLRLRSVRSDAEALLHPRGLGDFRVLVATVSGTE